MLRCSGTALPDKIALLHNNRQFAPDGNLKAIFKYQLLHLACSSSSILLMVEHSFLSEKAKYVGHLSLSFFLCSFRPGLGIISFVPIFQLIDSITAPPTPFSE
ncbi:hypothetical protein ACOSP7_010654 [Xanthoceras sorbifolium]